MTRILAPNSSQRLDGARAMFASGHGMCAQVRRPWINLTSTTAKRPARHLGDVPT
jgi:hypothetical protein